MKIEESDRAIYAVKTAWRREPIEDIEVRQLERMFLNYTIPQVREVIDDLIAEGGTRPSPAEFGHLLRLKTGRTLPGARVQRPGPFLEPLPPATDFDDRMAELRQMADNT